MTTIGMREQTIQQMLVKAMAGAGTDDVEVAADVLLELGLVSTYEWKHFSESHYPLGFDRRRCPFCEDESDVVVLHGNVFYCRECRTFRGDIWEDGNDD